MNSKALQTSSYIIIYLIFSIGSYYLFGTILPSRSSIISPNGNNKVATTTQTPKKVGIIDFAGPKTEICPLNGSLHTKEEKNIWETRRPLIVMIENHSDARPQSGLQNADIVYEAVAEGGITRFMAVYYCDVLKGSPNKYDVGPVRSARTYFLDLASEYADYPLYTHVGGANCSAVKDPVTGRQIGACTTNKKALAIEQISDYGWNNQGTWGDLSQFSLPYKVCRREPERIAPDSAMEHTMYCNTTELWNTAASRGLTNMTEIKKTAWNKNFSSWLFKSTDAANTAATPKKISFDFWAGYKDYSVSWEYDATKNEYLRSNGGKVHIDLNTGEQLHFKNLVIQFTKESRSIDEHLHNLYEVIGTGKGVLFQNGKKIEITWSKTTRTARTVFKDASGKEVNFVPGQIFVEILPIGSSINYED